MARQSKRSRRDAVVYQVYPRSFQDSNSDGIGDLVGITQRLSYVADLGVDAVWLSPIFVSPNADFGYDVSDYMNIDPVYGTLDDFRDLVQEAHSLGLEVLLDIVPCHTSIEHPWFRERPDWYIWSPIDGPANNWMSVFGSSAWERDDVSGRWYLHTFYKEQADLNWHNPEVVKAITDVMRTWIERGADGFRIDALSVLFKDAKLRDNPIDGAIAPEKAHLLIAEQIQTMHRPEIFPAIDKLRTALPEAFLVAEAAVPTSALSPYVRSVDLAFCFDFLHASLDVLRLREIISEAAEVDGIAWVLSNHDFSRLVSRWGEATARVAALLLLTLPGAAFIYQGDEIGMVDGQGGTVTYDRIGRDRFRHPMQWTKQGGFSNGEPWLPMTNPGSCNVADQIDEDDSMLSLYRSLIGLRRNMTGSFESVQIADDVIAYRRGPYLIIANLGETAADLPEGKVVLATDPRVGRHSSELQPYTGIILETK